MSTRSYSADGRSITALLSSATWLAEAEFSTELRGKGRRTKQLCLSVY